MVVMLIWTAVVKRNVRYANLNDSNDINYRILTSMIVIMTRIMNVMMTILMSLIIERIIILWMKSMMIMIFLDTVEHITTITVTARMQFWINENQDEERRAVRGGKERKRENTRTNTVRLMEEWWRENDDGSGSASASAKSLFLSVCPCIWPMIYFISVYTSLSGLRWYYLLFNIYLKFI